ncbi:hypothetical protein NDU88_007295 [Pleurodeles waltl]|uniref:ribonuclease H n=1 Tax=Pleurodeles waltl TaxID=8319 RepID=A0AAV7PT45_PLEWA|nr:hypothetical protein NDU88_007295 [Pleurodeles waltl]
MFIAVCSFPGVPSDRESKRMEQSAKKVFSSFSMALKSANATCILCRYIHAIMDAAKAALPDMPQDLQGLLTDAQAAATQVIQSGLDTTDSVARAMGTSIATRRHAWLRMSGFSRDIQATLLDLPFDGNKLFGTKADSALERFKEFTQEVSPFCGGVATLPMALNKEGWMVSVNLQDAYFHIPILKSHKKYLRFVVGSQHYQFADLPLGLTSVPRVFTNVMAVVAANLRRKGIAVFPYLDDWLIKAKSPELVLHHLQMTTQLLSSLGFSINVPKSHLEPSTPPVRRGSTGHKIESSLSSATADSGHSGVDSNVSRRSGCSSPQSPSSARSVHFLHSVGRSCMLPHESSSVVSLQAVVSAQRGSQNR